LSVVLGEACGADAGRERSSSPSSFEHEGAASEAEAEYADRQCTPTEAAGLSAYCAQAAAAEAGDGPMAAHTEAAEAVAATEAGAVPTPTTTATNTGYGTDTEGPELPRQQQQQQQYASAADSGAAAERVTSMMARQVARLVSSTKTILQHTCKCGSCEPCLTSAIVSCLSLSSAAVVV
jgi:hypothetical protein